MQSKPFICMFAKAPRAGLAKTRLAPAVGDEGAAALARAFMIDTWSMLRSLEWAHPVFATPAPVPPELGALLEDPHRPIDVLLQGEGDLGERIEHVLRQALRHSPVVMALGADSPGLPPRLLEQARQALEHADAVIGPSEDGGFYLLGLTRCPEGLLSGLLWSRSDTCERTMARLKERGVSLRVIERWFDVDEPEDLEPLCSRLSHGELLAPATAQALARWYLRRRSRTQTPE